MVRRWLASVAVVAMILPFPVIAQAEGLSTVHDVECALGGCDEAAKPVIVKRGAVVADDDDGESMAIGKEKGFTLGRLQAQAPVTHPAARPVRHAVATAAVAKPRKADMLLNFPLGSAELQGDAITRAQMFAVALKGDRLSSGRFVIEGHTDALGTREANLDLSRRRAQAVVDYLVAQGVPADHLTGKGYGSDKPRVAGNAANAGNRRVEIVRTM